MQKNIFLWACLVVCHALYSQTINLNTNGYSLQLTAVDTLWYEEFPLDEVRQQKITTDSTRLHIMKYRFGVVLRNRPSRGTPAFRTKFFRVSNGSIQAPTSTLFVKPVDSSAFRRLFEKSARVEAHPLFVGYYYLYATTRKWKSGEDIFNLCRQLVQDSIVSMAEPVYFRIIKRQNPLRPQQWNIRNDGSVPGSVIGADMGVEGAWRYSTGIGIRVAIIDDGVDLDHPDLQGNLLPGYDATGANSGGAPIPSNGHGTNCAGIIAAVDNNIGTIGVAYQAKIIPIRMGIVNSQGNFETTDARISDCFNEAVSRGADVLSNSWGNGSTSVLFDLAINNALSNGRRGLGSVIVFSTGNENRAVSYPASDERVIAVGASTPCDTRKRSSRNPADLSTGVVADPLDYSCDGERHWGSNYGTSLDVLAPGVMIRTTDNTGDDGIVAGDYNQQFNGTSAACPNAAAVVALILSANPNLTGKEARDILEQTCYKLPGEAYRSNVAGQPNGTWSDQSGYGRINAELAVCRAKSICGESNYPDANDYGYFAYPAPSQREIAYLKDGQLVYREGDAEIVLAPSAPKARSNSPVVAGGVGGELHFYYIGEDNRIHDIYQRTPGQWNYGLLHPAVYCKPNSAIAADFAYWSVNGQASLPFIFYINNDNRIGCLEYANRNWQNTVFDFGQTPKSGTPMTMIRQDQFPVLLYIGDDNRVHGFNKFHGQWYHIFPDRNAIKCRSNSPLVSGKYAIQIDQTNDRRQLPQDEDAHGFYIGEDNRLYTIWTARSDRGNWKTHCISQSIFAGPDSKLFFLRFIDTRYSKLVFQQSNHSFRYFRAADGAWLPSDPLVIPSDMLADPGTPIGISPSRIFYKTGGRVVGVRVF